MLPYIITAGLLIIWLYIYVKFFKQIRCGNMMLFSGGIKTGKTSLSVRQATQLHFWQKIKVLVLYNHFIRYIKQAFCKKYLPKKPKPLLYSNIPLKCKYVPVTKALLLREEKPVEKSVCYMSEASLIADSMTYKDPILNEELLLFNKLWGHASKGGYLIYDTQSVSDNHFAVKRCLNSYFYIHHTVKIPFFMIMFIREERYSEDSINTYGEDIEETMKIHIVPKSVWKKFDCYCYSVLTDDKPSMKEEDQRIATDLKAREIVSFKDYKTLKGVKK